MKSKLFRIPKTGTESFVVQVDRVEKFYDSRHYHPELQITLILEGTGTRFIGDSVDRFRAGDIFLIGPNLPHVFRNESRHNGDSANYSAASVSIYFKREVFGNEFYTLPETRRLTDLINRSYRGISVSPDIRGILAVEIESIVSLNGFEKVLKLLQILHLLSEAMDNSDSISSMSFTSPEKDSDNHRINDVFEHVMKYYNQDIKLDMVAGIASMSPTAFCRYFKSRTGNTFSEFLMKIRVGQACRLLIDEDMSIAQVCYESGFNNLSNFNRHFKLIAGCTPTEYIRIHNRAAV